VLENTNENYILNEDKNEPGQNQYGSFIPPILGRGFLAATLAS
jgi:hypothetical protein